MDTPHFVRGRSLECELTVGGKEAECISSPVAKQKFSIWQ